MALKEVQIHGWLKDVNDNFDELAGIVSDDVGLGALRVARFEFAADEEDSAGADNLAVGAHGVGVVLPAHAIIVGGFYDVNTPFTSAGNTATVAIHVEGANDIVTATAVSNAIYGTKGRKAIVPKANTPESTSVKTTEAREITCTVAVQALETGKLTGYLYFVEGLVSEDLPGS
jgi:hypothetical protein